VKRPPLIQLLAAGAPPAQTVAHYDHIIVIVEENKGYATVLDHGYAPNISRLAATYGAGVQPMTPLFATQ
jgi:hypothetical protein